VPELTLAVIENDAVLDVLAIAAACGCALIVITGVAGKITVTFSDAELLATVGKPYALTRHL
jgi:hypothetical protein